MKKRGTMDVSPSPTTISGVNQGSRGAILWIVVVTLIVAVAILAVLIYVAVVASNHDDNNQTEIVLRGASDNKKPQKKGLFGFRNTGKCRNCVPWTELQEYEFNRVVAFNHVQQLIFKQFVYGDGTTNAASPEDPAFEANFQLLLSTLTPEFLIVSQGVELRTPQALRAALTIENQQRSFQRRFISDIIILEYTTSDQGEQMIIQALEVFFIRDKQTGEWQNLLEVLNVYFVRPPLDIYRPPIMRDTYKRDPYWNQSSPQPHLTPLPSTAWRAAIVHARPIAEIPYGSSPTFGSLPVGSLGMGASSRAIPTPAIDPAQLIRSK